MAVNGKAYAHGSATHPARVLRNMVAAVFGQPTVSHANAVAPTTRLGAHGVAGSTELLVTSTGSLGWSCAAGRAVVTGTFALAQGAYTSYNDAAVTGTLNARNATNPRITLICLRVQDTDEDATGAEADAIVMIDGTAAATPAVPSIPSSLGSLLVLSEVLVPSTANGGAPTYTDRRSFLTAIGGMSRHRGGSPPSGAMMDTAIQTMDINTARTYKNSGGTWVPMSGRFGAAMGMNAVMPSGQTILTWNIEYEDSDNYSAVGTQTIVVPATLGGKYIISMTAAGGTAQPAPGSIDLFVNGSVACTQQIPTGTGYANCCRSIVLAGGQYVTADINLATSASYVCTIEVYRFSD